MKIVITNIYFGKPPSYFDLFLKSCALNTGFDFLFFVDFEPVFEKYPNVRFVKTTFSEIKLQLQAIFDFTISLNSPYKLCDFRPAYGEAFRDHFIGYDWWGHCDFDMIFGDLRPVINILNNSECSKLFRRGHLTLYKNVEEINAVYRDQFAEINYKQVFTSSSFFAFDETNGIDKIFVKNGHSVFRGELLADINSRSPYLKMTSHSNNVGQIFFWANGKIICKSGFYKDREFIYIHLQKRLMAKHYGLVPNEQHDIIINQFGIFDCFNDINCFSLRLLALLPNAAHLRRYYLPRFYKVVKTLGKKGAA
jgi:hypothetical protein